MASPQYPTSLPSVSGTAKVVYGYVFPVLLFVVLQPALLVVTDGNGGFEGMGVVLLGVVATPALLALNSWTAFIRWRDRHSLFLGGLLLPSVIGLVESLWTIGPTPIRHLIDNTIREPFLWIWLFIGLLFIPLIASAIHASRRRSA